MPKKLNIDERKVVELYRKFNSINRTALSVGCSQSTVKKILVKNNIEIKRYVPGRAAATSFN